MPVQVSYPGVYVQEVSSGVRTITGVSTSIAAFIGMTRRGVLDKPTALLSFADYERRFGADSTISEVTDQVRQFFLNGGKQAYVVRIAKGAVPADVGLQDELSSREVLKLTAKDAGTYGDTIRIEVDYNTPAPESTFNLRAFRQVPDGFGGSNAEEVETFQGLDMDPSSGGFAVDVINQQSNLLAAATGADFLHANVAPFQGYALSGRLFVNETALGTAILDAIDKTGPGGTGGTLGRFRVSVDGGPFVEVRVALTDIVPANAATSFAARINDSLLVLGTSVAGSMVTGPTLEYFRIRSAAVGGSVVFRPAPTEDITELLELGQERGGIEVGGFARRRPAPTGLFFRLGAFDSSPPAGALTALADVDQLDIDEYTLVDTAGSHTGTGVNLGPGGPMFTKGPSTSMRHVKERLDLLAARIRADAAGDPDLNWTAEVHGYRLVLTADFGNANTQPVSFNTTSASLSPHDLGAATNGMDQPNVRYYSLSSTGTSAYQNGAGTGGFDGLVPQLADYTKAFEAVRRDVDLFNLLILPRATGQNDTARALLWGPASQFCLDERAFLLVDPKNTWTEADTARTEVQDLRIGLVKDHSGVYWPRLTIADPSTGTMRNVDPSGSIAGLMARTDSNRGVWKAPAGVEADILGVRAVEHTMSDPENGLINPQAINAIRVFPNGIVSWGARTMDGFDNSGNDDYKYVPVRRLALFMEESLFRGLKFAVFEPNDEPLWAQIRLAAGAFMNNLFRQGAFQGQKSSDAYFVKVDSETTTQNDINLGIVNVVVGFAPLKPAEFVIITIKQKAGQVQV